VHAAAGNLKKASLELGDELPDPVCTCRSRDCEVSGDNAIYSNHGLVAQTLLTKCTTKNFRICCMRNAPLIASAFYLLADLEKGELRYANAGHPNPCAFIVRDIALTRVL
jgi:Stage II sporulation protein E (SpoIIE)